MSEHEIYEALGKLTAEIGGVGDRLDKIDGHIESQGEVLIELRTNLAAIRARSDDHTGRIHLVETKLSEHKGFQSRLGGIYVGIAVTLATLASMAALVKTFFGK